MNPQRPAASDSPRRPPSRHLDGAIWGLDRFLVAGTIPLLSRALPPILVKLHLC